MHFPHAIQVEGSIRYFISFLHTPAGHFFLFICASYSSLKYLIVVSTGFGAVAPKLQKEPSLIDCAISSRRSISPGFPSPFVISSTISFIFLTPTLHGTHFPQDSSSK